MVAAGRLTRRRGSAMLGYAEKGGRHHALLLRLHLAFSHHAAAGGRAVRAAGRGGPASLRAVARLVCSRRWRGGVLTGRHRGAPGTDRDAATVHGPYELGCAGDLRTGPRAHASVDAGSTAKVGVIGR